ncbi:MAG: class IV adenylate cyclase [bacterium]
MTKPEKNIEKEIKIKVENIAEIGEILKRKNAKCLGKSFQRTIRFDTEDCDLEKNKTFIRVRSGFGNVVTLKKKTKTNENVFERVELETEVSDIEIMRKIFHNLGYTREFIMEKYRTNWEYNDTKISFDEMPFGLYVEIEGEEAEIFETAEELGLDLSNKITVTYWDLFEDYKKETGISGENIVFSKGYKSKSS